MRSSAGSRTGGALPVLFPLGPCTQDQRGCHQGRSRVGRWARSSKRQTEASLPMLATGSSSSAGAGASAHRPSVPSGPDRRGPRGWHGASAGFWKQRVKSASSNLAPKGQPPAPEVARRPRIATAVQGWLALRGPGVFTEPLLSPRWVAALTAGGSGWGAPPAPFPPMGRGVFALQALPTSLSGKVTRAQTSHLSGQGGVLGRELGKRSWLTQPDRRAAPELWAPSLGPGRSPSACSDPGMAEWLKSLFTFFQLRLCPGVLGLSCGMCQCL